MLPIALALFAALAAPADKLPAFTDYVVDKAGVIDGGSLQHLKTVCSRLDHAGIAQVAVATLPDLGDASKEEVAVDLFQKWGLGHGKKKADGLLVLLVPGKPGHRRLKVEVGSNLEGILPDGRVGALEDQYAVPALKRDAYGEAAVRLVDAFAQILEADAAAGGDAAPGASSMRGGRGVRGQQEPAYGGLLVALAAMLALLVVLATSGARHSFPGTKTSVAAAGLSLASVIALFSSASGAGWVAFIVGIILNAIVWASIQAHKCPRDGSWMTIDEEVIDPPTYFSSGVAHVTRQCTNRRCGFRNEYDKELPRKQMAAVSGGGGGGWGGGGGGGGDGFSGGGGGDSGGGGAGRDV